jgi:TolB-like protein/DNA-binding winged helix-turn-helix (wHTH) protein/Tfp pilus assembly protein PilF
MDRLRARISGNIQGVPMQEPLTIFRFGPFELRPQTRELFKGKTRLKLRPQPFRILEVMLEHPGEVVTREELQGLLWSAGTYVDFEHGLNASIKELRGVLSDSASESRYVETLPKLGYRIIVPVTIQEPRSVRASLQQPGAAGSKNRAKERIFPDWAQWQKALRRWPAILGILVTLIATLAGYFQWSRGRESQRLAGGRMMLAVLPFDNLTGDSGQDYFSDGLTEEMISQLGSLDPQRMGVIARTSVMHYQHSQKPLEQIGRELGVQYVLEGSVRRDADKVRVSAQLIQMKDQSHLWAQQYDRELTGVLALQGEIARAIADQIQLTIGDPKPTFTAIQPVLSRQTYDAYDLYLKGRFFWNKRSIQGFERAVECFQQAIARDPTYARAYAGLADSYALMSNSLAPQNEFMPKARTAALKALQLDEQLAEAHTSLALIEANYDWDWQNADKEFRRAIRLDPNYATAHQWYAENLAFQGRFDEAFSEIERARQVDPLSLIIAADGGAILYFSRQYDRSIERFRATLDMEPNFSRAHLIIYAYTQKGQFADALAEIEKWRRIDDTPWTWAIEAYVYGRSGQQEKARQALTKFEEGNRERRLDPTPILIVVYTGTNQKDKAFNLLQKASSMHSNVLTTLKVDPIYDPLRDDPRFQELLRHVGLAQ